MLCHIVKKFFYVSTGLPLYLETCKNMENLEFDNLDKKNLELEKLKKNLKNLEF